MFWNEPKDIFLLREMVSQDLFTHKTGSRERGAVWQLIATNLNCFEGFNVTSRGVRDRYTTISKKFKAQENKELKKTGEGEIEYTEFEALMEEVIGMNVSAELKHEQESQANKKAASEDRNKALQIRQAAMESFSETKKRAIDEGDEKSPKEKKIRRNSSDTISFLKEKLELDQASKKEEREIISRQQEQMTNILHVFQQQLQQQQQQQSLMQQQMLAMMQQQQQQFQTLLEKDKN